MEATGRFNERFLLSLASCKACVFMDDEMNILPISSHISSITPVSVKEVLTYRFNIIIIFSFLFVFPCFVLGWRLQMILSFNAYILKYLFLIILQV
jgi:hypothetical protein